MSIHAMPTTDANVQFLKSTLNIWKRHCETYITISISSERTLNKSCDAIECPCFGASYTCDIDKKCKCAISAA